MVLLSKILDTCKSKSICRLCSLVAVPPNKCADIIGIAPVAPVIFFKI